MEDMRKYVCQPGSSFETAISSRLSVLNARNLERETCPERVLFYEEETMFAAGQQRKLKRLYVRKPNEKHVGVGWVINEDINICMICARQFGFFLYRHHCRSCGNLVCDPCSPHLLVLEELSETGPQRVCIQCYWGQDPVHVARWRVNSEYCDDDVFDGEQSEDKFAMLDDTDSDTTDNLYAKAPDKKANENKIKESKVSIGSTTDTSKKYDDKPQQSNNVGGKLSDRTSPVRNHNKLSISQELDIEFKAVGRDPVLQPVVTNGSSQGENNGEISVVPIPGVCLKTKTTAGFKVFVNVCHHHLVPVYGPVHGVTFDVSQLNVVIGTIRDTADKKGEESCKLVDVAVNSERYKEHVEDPVRKEKVNELIATDEIVLPSYPFSDVFTCSRSIGIHVRRVA
jgi:hypothetical protein